MQRYDKLHTALKYFLIGRKYHSALCALNFAKIHHTGVRKDGVTPEFQHQIEIALYITTLPDLMYPEVTLGATLLHDVIEDYNVSPEEMRHAVGQELTDISRLLSKKEKYSGAEKPLDVYFADIAKHPVCSIIKGADRIHNVQSMIGVFGTEKQAKYLDEVEHQFIPMLKTAKYNFPQQTAAYFNILHMLRSQTQLIRAMHRNQGAFSRDE